MKYLLFALIGIVVLAGGFFFFHFQGNPGEEEPLFPQKEESMPGESIETGASKKEVLEQEESSASESAPAISQVEEATEEVVQKDFRMAFVLLIRSSSDATPGRINKINEIKNAFPNSFKTATRNLATMDTSSDIVIMTVDSGPDITSFLFDWGKYPQKFYEDHEDNFDFISFYTAFKDQQSQAHLPVSNAIKGIGNVNLMNSARGYGSGGRLKGLNFMGDITIFERLQLLTIEHSLNALKHETGHQWCCYIMDSREENGNVPLIQEYSHWNFFLDLKSINDGYIDPLGGTDWIEVEKNKFKVSDRLRYIEARYSPLTLYLMGLLSAEDVPPIPLIRPFDSVIEKSTYPPNEVDGIKEFVSMEDIIAREGKWRCCFSP